MPAALKRTHRPGFGDSFFENLAVSGFLVVRDLLRIDRLVQLSGVGIDAELAEHAFHAEGPRFVGHDRHHVLADLLVAAQGDQRLHDGKGRADLLVLQFLDHLAVIVQASALPSSGMLGGTARDRTAQALRGVPAGT